MVSGTFEASSVPLVISCLLALIRWDTAGHMSGHCPHDARDDGHIHTLSYRTACISCEAFDHEHEQGGRKYADAQIGFSCGSWQLVFEKKIRP